jgi:hypothetical protein
MNKIITKETAALAGLATAKSSYGLSFVRITDEYCEATNAKILGRVYHRDDWRDMVEEFPVVPGAEELPEGDVYISADKLKKLFAGRGKLALPVLEMALICQYGENPAAVVTDLESHNITKMTAENNWPDTDRIMQRPTGAGVCQGLRIDTQNLIALADFLKCLCGKEMEFTAWNIYDESKPIFIDVQTKAGLKAMAMFMPAKNKGE